MGMYHNAALEYYGPQGSQNAGLGAIIAQGGGGARSLVPAQAAYRPPQKDAIAEANQMAGLVTNGAKAWDARPNFMRSASDVAARNQTEMAQKAVELQKIQWAKDHGYDLDGSSNSTPPTNPDPSAPPTNSAPSTSASPHAELDVDQEAFVPDEFARRGGLINHRNHYRGDGFVPYGGGLGGGFLSGILQDQAQEPTRQLMDSKTKPTAPKPQSSPVGEAMQIASFGKMGKGAYDWAGKQLAGEASPTGVAGATGDAAAGLGGAEAGGGALAGDVGGGTGAILGDVGADVAGGAAADAAAGLGADVAVDAAAPEMMAGLAGSEGVADFLPFLFLKNGGAAQNRRHFETDANVPVVNGDDTDQTTIVGKGNKLPKVPVPDNRPGPEDALVSSAPTRSPKGGVAPSSSFSMPDFSGLVPEGAKDTLTSENFWVPALAGIGSMLASPNKTLLGAVGSGLVGGTTAYTNFSQQNANQLSKRIEMAKNVFSGPYEKNGVRYWRMAGRAEPISEAEYPDLWNKFVNGEDTDTQPKSVAKSTTDLAKTVSPAKVTPPTSPTGTQSAPSPAATAPATAAPATAPGTTERATPPAPATPAPATTQAPAAGQLEPVLAKDPNELKDQILSDNARWKDKPLFRNAPMLLQKAQEETDNANRLTTRAAEVGAGDTVNAKADENALLAEAKRSSENAKMYHEASQKLVDDAAAPTISRLNANDAENVKYFNDQATTDQARQQSRMQVNAIRDILENFEPGTFAEQKAHFAGVLRSLGVPPEKIQSATVNAPAFQEFTKDMMRGVFSDVAKIGGQLRVAELAGLEKASANPSLQPEANQKILSQALGVLNAEDQRFRDEQDARKKFGWNFDRSDFQNKWHEQNKDIGKFVSEAGKNIAVRGATPADWSKLQPGQAYIVEPTNDPNKRGVKVPTKLRYLGADPQTGNHRWAPISGG